MSDRPHRTTVADPDPGGRPESDPALLDRVLAEQRQRWQQGDRVPVEQYLEQWPALRDDAEAVLQLIFNEVVLRERGGEVPRPEEYQTRFPPLAGQIELQFAMDRALRLDRLTGPAATRATSPLLTDPVRHSARAGDLPSVPGFELLGVLGRGGMGVVYQAWQQSLSRLVAVKMTPAGADARPDDLARFRAEAEAVARLQHPNIVQVYETGDQGGRPYFVMEYVDGGSLDRLLAGAPRPVAEAARLTETLARAVHYAHLRGVVHRDLKPANVLLASGGCEPPGERSGGSRPPPADLVPKITDFGLAKILVGGRLDQTRSGAVLGTPSYMAPEQAGGRNREVGPWTDVYALGAMLYECLTGRPPFLGATPVETVMQVLEQEPVSPRRLNPQVPADLQTICLKCLEKSPQRRYATALELADDLARFLDHRPIRARPIGRPARAARWCRRNPALAAASALAAACLAAAVGVSVWFGVYQYRAAAALRAQRRQTDRLAAGLAVDRGVSLCERGAVAEGLLWLARSLEMADEADDEGLRFAARANLALWGTRLHRLRACLAHPGPVRAVAVSPDGATVATGCEDGQVRFWGAAAGAAAGEPLRHAGAVHALAFTPDGQSVLTGSADGSARLWDATRRRPTGPPLEPGAAVLAVAVGPDGRTAVTGSADGTAQVWDAVTGQRRGPPLRHTGAVRAVAFAPDGRTVWAGGAGQEVRAWRVATGEPAGPVLKHDGPVAAVAVHPDGRLFAGTLDWSLLRWDRPDGPPADLLKDSGPVTAVALNRDGTRLLAGCAEPGLAYLLDATSGAALGPPLPHRGSVLAAAWAPDGRWVATGSADGTARLWDLSAASTEPTRLWHESRVRVVAFRPDGRAVVTGDDSGAARAWDVPTGRPLGPVLAHGRPVRAATFRDGRTLLTAGADGRVWAWDPTTGHGTGTASLGTAIPPGASFSPDGKYLLTACEKSAGGPPVPAPCQGNEARLWDVATGRPVGEPLRHAGFVTWGGFSPDGRTALTGSEDGTARLWEVATGRAVGVPLRHPGQVVTAAFSPDGRVVLTGCKDYKARLWDAATGSLLGPPLPHQADIWGVAFSPEGRVVVTCCHDGQARLWGVESGKQLGPPLPHNNVVLAAAFSPDGRALLTACWGKNATLWPVAPPMAGDVGQVRLGTETATGMELKSDGEIRLLDAADWHDRHRRWSIEGR